MVPLSSEVKFEQRPHYLIYGGDDSNTKVWVVWDRAEGGAFQAEAKASLTFFRLAKTLLRSVITKKVSIHGAEAGRSQDI